MKDAMRCTLAIVVLIAAALSGCAQSHVAGTLFYMTPHRFEEFDCKELKRGAGNARGRLKATQDLRDRASGSAAGPVINTMVYGPDYQRAAWEVRLYEDEIARKNCDAPPPPPEPPPQ
jgi:hypothetical protein